MSDESDLHDTIQTVVKRTTLLDRLACGPTDKRDLRDHLDVSRSTVYKAVQELEEYDLVSEDGGTVRLTVCGQLLVSQYQEFMETATNICNQHQLLSTLPPDAPVTTDLLAGADSVVAERHAPNQPLDYVEDLTLAADTLFGLAPAVFRRYVDLFREQLVAGELAAELVLERPVLEYVREAYRDRFAESLAVDQYELRTTDAALPFGLLVTEGDRTEVAVVVYEDEGKPKGVIANDTPAALDWGRNVFEQYRDDAIRVETE